MNTVFPTPLPSVPTKRPVRIPLRRVVASAPMRVSFAGGGTDLPHVARRVAGRVVGSALDLRTVAVVEPFDAGWVRLASPAGGALRRSVDPPCDQVALRLLEAVLSATGVHSGVSLQIDTDVAPGAGLGGSASAAVAALFALRAALGEPPGPADLAHEAARVERERLRIAGGVQDQVFAAFGGILDLAFDSRGCSGIRPVVAPESFVAELGAGLLLVDTGVRRVSGEVLKAARPPEPRVISELVAAAEQVAAGFAAASLEQVLAGMRRSAAAKASSAPAANALGLEIAERVQGLGVEVVRVCGAGGGGHVMVWAPPDRHDAISEALGEFVVRRPSLNAPGVRIDD